MPEASASNLGISEAAPSKQQFLGQRLGVSLICAPYKIMSAAQRMPIVGGTLALGISGAAMALIPSLREAVTRYLGISAPGGIWRILAIFFALLSLKSLPFVWHVSSLLPFPTSSSLLY
jgi:hypothetical protein